MFKIVQSFATCYVVVIASKQPAADDQAIPVRLDAHWVANRHGHIVDIAGAFARASSYRHCSKRMATNRDTYVGLATDSLSRNLLLIKFTPRPMAYSSVEAALASKCSYVMIWRRNVTYALTSVST